MSPVNKVVGGDGYESGSVSISCVDVSVMLHILRHSTIHVRVQIPTTCSKWEKEI